ncbi:MAG: ABC transporter ATP-binding protein [Methanobacteriaceae archaeon]|jgi:NitT/TauT family transport system ATP-binding protein
MSKIIMKNVSKRFVSKEKTIKALDTINLEVEEGEFLCIVGPSGCGKTTLLRIIAGLDKPTTGEISIDGRVVEGPGYDRGFVFQQYSLFPWRSVIENVAFGLEMKGISEDKRYEIAEEYLKLVGLERFKDCPPYELSGGMKQRVAIVRALANDPEVLLMDEPFAALDIQTRNLLQRELLKIWKDTKKTIVFITHNVDEAVFLGDRIVVMSARPGKIINVFEVDIERIRNRVGKDFLKIRGKILDILEKEIEIKVSPRIYH